MDVDDDDAEEEVKQFVLFIRSDELNDDDVDDDEHDRVDIESFGYFNFCFVCCWWSDETDVGVDETVLSCFWVWANTGCLIKSMIESFVVFVCRI